MNLIEESEGELHDLSTDSGGCCWNSSLSTTVACLDRRLQFDEIVFKLPRLRGGYLS